MALKWPIMCWCAVKKLLTHSSVCSRSLFSSSGGWRWSCEVSFWLMHLDALSSQLNDVVSNSSSPATALSLTAEAEDFSTSQAVTYAAKWQHIDNSGIQRRCCHWCLYEVEFHLWSKTRPWDSKSGDPVSYKGDVIFSDNGLSISIILCTITSKETKRQIQLVACTVNEKYQQSVASRAQTCCTSTNCCKFSTAVGRQLFFLRLPAAATGSGASYSSSSNNLSDMAIRASVQDGQ